MLVGLYVGKREARPWIVSDELWLLVEPLLPVPAPKLMPGRPRVPDRQALCGTLFVLHTGIQWEYLPQELGFGSGMTCWRRLAAWNEAGVWDRLHVVLLARLRAAKQLDWSRAVIDSSHVRAARRGPKAAPARSTASTAAWSGLGASNRSSPDAVFCTVLASEFTAGLSSARSPGSTASDVSASAGRDVMTSTKPSSASPPASSPTATSNAFVRTS